MLISVPDALSAEQVAQGRQILDHAEWVDGRVTAGHQSSKAKDNLQIPEGHPAARQLGDLILKALGKNPSFLSAALPAHVFPPLINKYSGGQSFGTHVDNAIRQVPSCLLLTRKARRVAPRAPSRKRPDPRCTIQAPKILRKR